MITKIGQEEEEASSYRSVTREGGGQAGQPIDSGRVMITKKGREVFNLQVWVSVVVLESRK